MDRKTILVLIASFAVLYLWMWGVGKLYPPVPRPMATNVVATAASGDGVSTNEMAPAPAAPVSPLPPVATAPVAAFDTNIAEQVEMLDTPEARYTFTSRGGGLKEIALKRYLQSVRADRVAGSNEWVVLNDRSRLPVLSIQADGALGDNHFQITRSATNSILAEKVMPNGLRVVKEFTPASNYEVQTRVWLENTGEQPITLPPQFFAAGTATPAGPEDNPQMMGVFWFNGQKAEHVQQGWFENRTMGCLWSNPRHEYISGEAPVNWSAVHSQFFTIAVVPATNAIASRFTARQIDLPQVEGSTNLPNGKVERGFETTITYPVLTLAPKEYLERRFTIYAGPKQEKTLARHGRQLDEIMDFGFFSPISKIFLRAMNWLSHWMPYGVAIIVITVIIKLVFWPLTQASTRSMKRMQALAPEMKKIQEKYKDDPVKMNKKTMEFWREHKVSPLSGCWPMLIQLPIFFALFRMIPNAIELRGTRFLWIYDLSRPDTIFYFPGIDFPFNPLPLLMGVTMLWQARLMPASPTMDPAQQALMKYMPLLFLIFLYNQPAGLTLYWTVQNLLSILQTKMTKAQEEKSAVVPAPAVVPAKKRK